MPPDRNQTNNESGAWIDRLIRVREHSRLWLEAPIVLALFGLVLTVLLAAKGFSCQEHFFGLGLSGADWPAKFCGPWTYRRVFLGQDGPFHFNSLFYPYGFGMVVLNNGQLTSLLGGFFALITSPIRAHYLMFSYLLLGNGLGGYLLVRRLTGNRIAAWSSGLLMMLSGFTAWSLNHLHFEYGGWLWICLFLLFLDRLFKSGKRKDILPAVIFGSIACLANLIYAIHLALLSGLLVAFLARTLDKKKIVNLTLTALLIAALLSPMVVLFIKDYSNIQYLPTSASDQKTAENSSPDKIDSPVVPLMASHALNEYAPWNKKHQSEPDADTYYFLWILTGLSLVLMRRRSTPWLVAAGVFFLLSLGPYLQWLDQSDQRIVTSVPLPFLVAFEKIPLFSLIQFPNRIFSFVLISLCVVMGFVIDHLTKSGPKGKKLLVSCLIVCWTLAELSAGWSVQLVKKPPLNPFYQKIAQMPEDFALIELPFNFANIDFIYIYYQAWHGKSLFNGGRHPSRQDDPTRGLLGGNPLLRRINQMQKTLIHREDMPDTFVFRVEEDGPTASPEVTDLYRGAEDLARLGFRYVICHKELAWDGGNFYLPKDSGLPELLDSALGQPTYQDQELIVWRLPTP